MGEMISSADNCNFFPLYLYQDTKDLLGSKAERSTNLTPEFIKAVSNRIGNTETSSLMPIDMFHYAYAVFHSPIFRDRYSEFLKSDFPRLPITNNLTLFIDLAYFGRQLVDTHLLNLTSQKFDRRTTFFIGSENLMVENISYSDKTVWVDKAKTRGFQGVSEEVWNFKIGNYQVCEKWLKDRQAKGGRSLQPGRILVKEDIAHYQKIILVVKETIRIMAEIDEVIEAHGGWPDAFSNN